MLAIFLSFLIFCLFSSGIPTISSGTESSRSMCCKLISSRVATFMFVALAGSITTSFAPQVDTDAWKIGATANGSSVQILVPQVANRGFEVQWTSSLSAPISWLPLDVPANRPFFSASDLVTVVEDSTVNSPGRFYRVRVFEP